mgnify:CR=1 FL=1
MQSLFHTCKVFVVDAGYECCQQCGKIKSRELDADVCAFAQSTSPMCNSYTRSKRFKSKILGVLLCRVTQDLDPMLVNRVASAVNPEDVLEIISCYEPRSNQRRPYLQAVAYWIAANKPMSFPKQSEIDHYVHRFESIFFARARLQLDGPNFPYLALLEMMVHDNKDASDEMRFLMRFVRKLRCRRRRRRYQQQFINCLHYIQINNERYSPRLSAIHTNQTSRTTDSGHSGWQDSISHPAASSVDRSRWQECLPIIPGGR